MGKTTQQTPAPGVASSPLAEMITAQDRDTITMVRNALDEKRVMLAFQPVMQSAHPDRAAFYEGLIRVLDRKGRIIPAADFMGAIEQQELGRIIDALTLEKALEALAVAPDLRLSINMSARTIGYSHWKYALNTGLKRDASLADRLIIEISESSAIAVPEIMHSFVNELQRKGISFALDNFGAGNSSFKCLRNLYADMLKIDGAFIRGLHENADNQAITKAMIAMAQELDIVTIAQSVENHHEANLLIEMGVDCMQGYYFGMPTITPYWQKTDPRRNIA